MAYIRNLSLNFAVQALFERLNLFLSKKLLGSSGESTLLRLSESIDIQGSVQEQINVEPNLCIAWFTLEL
ncbi:hypothetical protein BKG91_05615 [Rodentibacter caecimuris]|uniref:Uncharacterized protein n=1 Tax=Rodentibacter caecimuris TaxID=1796644 RepID=A0A9X8VYH7_9PAST|nr:MULTISPECIES: hypothetical protein [Pasteurellaceae]AOF52139.1 hypothetical protein AC062_0039 [Pasteurellaceae bacterium NI1060]MCQ9122648.1 hypothetical protein [Rodentibacter heylii]MCR1837774.1 hypothetical protein [Pasteurella caecimuris]MCU0106449.1 hypothetical protein [Pasteurella caecimuris]MCX2960436.1 hypothetical protein [Rodentibacter heylii]